MEAIKRRKYRNGWTRQNSSDPHNTDGRSAPDLNLDHALRKIGANHLSYSRSNPEPTLSECVARVRWSLRKRPSWPVHRKLQNVTDWAWLIPARTLLYVTKDVQKLHLITYTTRSLTWWRSRVQTPRRVLQRLLFEGVFFYAHSIVLWGPYRGQMAFFGFFFEKKPKKWLFE